MEKKTRMTNVERANAIVLNYYSQGMVDGVNLICDELIKSIESGEKITKSGLIQWANNQKEFYKEGQIKNNVQSN